jgi:hypothetical protein
MLQVIVGLVFGCGPLMVSYCGGKKLLGQQIRYFEDKML